MRANLPEVSFTAVFYRPMKPLPKTPASSRPAWLQAAALLFVSSAAIATISLQARADAEAVAAIFPPWWSAQQAMSAATAAGASVIRTGAIPIIMVVQPARENGLTRLRDAGAWFALDPQAVAACFSNSTATRPEGSGA